MWPGFGDNSRVLKWVLERLSGTGKAVETPIKGFVCVFLEVFLIVN